MGSFTTVQHKCKYCGKLIVQEKSVGRPRMYHKECYKIHRYLYKRKWDSKNRPVKHGFNYNKLGNPMQDEEILDFIRRKKLNVKTKKYNALPDSAFSDN